MTADVELLPCPGCNGASVRVIGGPGTKGGPQYWAGCDYCRWRTWGNTGAEAIAEWNRRATAARDAEIEALRAEVATWEGLHASEVQVRQRWQARAERLADALRHQRWCRTCAEDGWESCEEGRKNDALLRDQED